MKPFSPLLLGGLILALCGLCLWQWQRESSIRQLATEQQSEITTLRTSFSEAEARAQSANAEILRLTGTVQELRTTSIPKATHDETLASLDQLKKHIEQQAQAITQRDQIVTKNNDVTAQANTAISKLTRERDDLAKRVNDLTKKLNEKR
jgi:chromosome segregation ATPase